MTDGTDRQRNVQLFRDLLSELSGGEPTRASPDTRSAADPMKRLHELRERFNAEPAPLSASARRTMGLPADEPAQDEVAA